MREKLSIFSGNANRELAQEICDYLGVSLGDATVARFPDGEVHVQINENIRGKDVFIVQPTCAPPNENLMELLILIDAARRASATRVSAVLPFFGYARQDRKDKPRVPITSKLISNLLTTAGASRVLTMDLHAGQIQGFFDIPVDHLYSINVIVEYLQSLHLRNAAVVSPDIGGVRMARAYSKMLNFPLAIVDKRRESDRQTKVMNIIGEVKGRNVILVDDMVSTGGSLVEAVGALKDEGALDIYAAIVHPVLAESAAAKLERSPLKEIVVTNSIPLGAGKQSGKIHVVSVAPLLAEAIRRIHNDESVSALFSRAVVES